MKINTKGFSFFRYLTTENNCLKNILFMQKLIKSQRLNKYYDHLEVSTVFQDKNYFANLLHTILSRDDFCQTFEHEQSFFFKDLAAFTILRTLFHCCEEALEPYHILQLNLNSAIKSAKALQELYTQINQDVYVYELWVTAISQDQFFHDNVELIENLQHYLHAKKIISNEDTQILKMINAIIDYILINQNPSMVTMLYQLISFAQMHEIDEEIKTFQGVFYFRTSHHLLFASSNESTLTSIGLLLKNCLIKKSSKRVIQKNKRNQPVLIWPYVIGDKGVTLNFNTMTRLFTQLRLRINATAMMTQNIKLEKRAVIICQVINDNLDLLTGGELSKQELSGLLNDRSLVQQIDNYLCILLAESLYKIQGKKALKQLERYKVYKKWGLRSLTKELSLGKSLSSS